MGSTFDSDRINAIFFPYEDRKERRHCPRELVPSTTQRRIRRRDIVTICRNRDDVEKSIGSWLSGSTRIGARGLSLLSWTAPSLSWHSQIWCDCGGIRDNVTRRVVSRDRRLSAQQAERSTPLHRHEGYRKTAIFVMLREVVRAATARRPI